MTTEACGPCSLGVHHSCHRAHDGDDCGCEQTHFCGTAIRVFVAEAPAESTPTARREEPRG